MRPRSAFIPALLLAIILIATKAVLSWRFVKQFSDLTKVLTVSAEDLIAVLIYGVAATLALRLTVNRPRLHRWAWRLTLAVGAIAALYAIVNIGVVRALGYPLNARMLGLIGRFDHLRSSIAEHADAVTLTALAATPLLFLLISWLLRVSPRRWVTATLVLIAAAWIVAGSALRAQADPDSWLNRVGKNAHRELLGSLASRYLTNQRVSIDTPFPPEFLDDFRLASTRAHPPLPQFTPPPRNVIVIVLESVTTQYLSLYGSKYDTTPSLIAESANAMVFDRVYAHVGATYAARLPLLFAKHPGLPWRFWYKTPRPLPPGLGMLMKEQRNARTAFFSTCNVDWDHIDYTAKVTGCDEVLGPVELGGLPASSWGTEDRVAIDGMMKWIQKDTTRPFYAMLWTDQTHDPYTLESGAQPIDFVGNTSMRYRDALNRYLNTVKQADRHVGRLLQFLRDKKLADDTLVVITGDHGEAFGELHEEAVSHGGGLYEECLRVPFILWNPRFFPTRQINHRAGGHIDLHPTLAHIMGLEPSARWQGASLFGPDHPNRAYVWSDLAEYQFGVINDRFKYMLHVSNGFERLFDLKEDPGERKDVSRNHPDLCAEMRARVSAFIHATEQHHNSGQ